MYKLESAPSVPIYTGNIGTTQIPKAAQDLDERENNYVTIKIYCGNEKCEWHRTNKQAFPIYSIDEDVYEIAKFYIKVAHLIAAIAMTINPRYIYTDLAGREQDVSIFDKSKKTEALNLSCLALRSILENEAIQFRTI